MNKINFKNIPIPEIKPNGSDWIMNGKYQAKLKENIQDEKPLKYLCEEKEISFKPVGLRWNNELNEQKIIKTGLDSSVGQQIENGMEVEGRKGDEAKGIIYKNALGKGINLGVLTHKTLWRKILKISSLKKLGKIPANAEFLEISFEIENTFGLKVQEIKENIKLGEKSWIRKAEAWDSFHEIEFLDEVDENGNLVGKQENRIEIKSEIRERNGKMYLVKMLPVEWLKTALFPIYTDTDITYGTASEFEAGGVKYVSCCEISSNKFAVCFMDDSNSDKGKARVATVIGTAITWGAVSEFESGITKWIACAKLATDKFVVAFMDDSDGDKGKARAVTVSGTTIGTWGTIEVFENTGIGEDAEEIGCCQLGTDKFVITYYFEKTIGKKGYAIVGTVSTTTITFGTRSEFEDGWVRYTTCAKLDTDKFVVVFEDSGDSGKCKARAVTVSTRTIGEWGTLKTLDTNDSYFIDCDQIDTDKFVAVWAGGSGHIGQAKVCTVSGTTITAGSVATFESGGVENSEVAKIDTTHFVVAYCDIDDSDKGKSNYCSLSGTAITPGTPEEFESGSTGGSTDMGLDIALIGSDKIAIAFQDDADTDKGKAIIGDTPSVGSPSSSVSPSASISPSASVSPSASISPSISPSASISPSSSVSLSVSPSSSVSPSVSPSASVSPSSSVSPSVSPSASVSPSVSPSASVSPSVSPSASVSPSVSPSASVSPSVSPSASVSPSSSVSPSVSPSASVSPSVSPSPNPYCRKRGIYSKKTGIYGKKRGIYSKKTKRVCP